MLFWYTFQQKLIWGYLFPFQQCLGSQWWGTRRTLLCLHQANSYWSMVGLCTFKESVIPFSFFPSDIYTYLDVEIERIWACQYHCDGDWINSLRHAIICYVGWVYSVVSYCLNLILPLYMHFCAAFWWFIFHPCLTIWGYGSFFRYKFDDERVTKEDVKRALEEQYGGEEEVICLSFDFHSPELSIL